MNDRPFTHEDLITAWQSSASCAEVLRKLGIEDNRRNYAKISQMGFRLRQAGVPLKRFGNRGPTLDISKLIAVAIAATPKEIRPSRRGAINQKDT